MNDLLDRLAELEAQNESLRASNRGICALADERSSTIYKLRIEVRALERKNALLRSGIDPDESIAEIVALCLNIRTIGERVGESLDEVPVC